MKSEEERLEHLAKCYSSLYIFLMKKLGMDKELEQYMEECKSCLDDEAEYSKYVHGYWLPFLRQQKELESLNEGRLDCIWDVLCLPRNFDVKDKRRESNI